jgi:hypothetical protein
MPEFSLELYLSRTAQIKARRAEAQADYESAALAAAMDPTVGGQAEARAVCDDLDAQQSALDAAFQKFTRDGREAARVAAIEAWEKRCRKVEEISAAAVLEVEDRLLKLAAEADEIAARYQQELGRVRETCAGVRINTSNLQPGDIVGGRFAALNKLRGDGGAEVNRGLRAGENIRELLAAFQGLEERGLAALHCTRPEPERYHEERRAA